ncbi:MAG: DMT family transporter [Eubacteriales bacterium]|nr:DMT family transporter [Eubacteriales bacterium]MDD4390477.1 DMT family transporter [Eubacteriales bacterium]
MTKQTRSNFLLLLTAFIWGAAFVAQKAGLDYVGPFTFNCIRFIIGAIVLIPVIMVMNNNNKKNERACKEEPDNTIKNLLLGGFFCGIVIFGGTTLQQIGLLYTDAGKAGFITALYIVLVPILGTFIGKKITRIVLFCVAIAAVGLYLLCAPPDGLNPLDFNRGDLLMIISSFFFASHILVVDHFSRKCDGVTLSCLQFAVCGTIAILPMMLFEHPQLSNIIAAYIPLLFTGVMSCSVAYTLQIIAQKHTEPTAASLIMSTEAVFAVLTGMIILNETLSTRELAGCVIMFIAMVITQLPESKRQELSLRLKQAKHNIK